MEQALNAFETIAPQSLEQALALLQQREAELAALRSAQQDWMHAVSHDLRAPLRHLLAFNPLIAELLQVPDPGPEDLQEALSFVQTMEQSARRMAAMFDGLQQLARAARQQPQWQAVDLRHLLQAVQQRLQADAGAAAGRSVEWALPAACPEVRADPQLLEQALTAALSNALKFTRPVARARIQVDAGVEQGCVRIAVSDNGVGFDASRAGALFGIFQRMHREAEFEGLGTGLALVRSVCRLHGGDARIEARPGQGCALHMGWPLRP